MRHKFIIHGIFNYISDGRWVKYDDMDIQGMDETGHSLQTDI